MKKTVAYVLAVILCVSNVLAGQEVNLKFNNKSVNTDVPAQIVEGRTLVPLRAIFEALGAKVEWIPDTKKIKATKGKIVIEMFVNNREYHINGKEKYMDVPAQVINGRTMVPARYAAEAFGLKVNWKADTKTVDITSNNNVSGSAIKTNSSDKKAESTTKGSDKKAEATTKGSDKKAEATTKANDKKAEAATKANDKKAEAATKANDKKAEATTKANDKKAESTTKANDKKAADKKSEASTETTTMYNPNMCCDIPDVKVDLHKVVLGDIKLAVKGYNIGNASSLNRLKDATRKAFVSQWDSKAVSPNEKEFVKQSKLIYQYIVLCYKKIDIRYSKHLTSESIQTQCKNNKEKIDNYLIRYYTTNSLEEVKKIADSLQKLSKSLPTT